MKFNNPWIDPRVLQVNPDSVRAYLLDHGWKEVGPADVPDLLMFETPNQHSDYMNVLLPLQLDYGHQRQRLIELISQIAMQGDRYAVEVLDEILRYEVDKSANGATAQVNQDDSVIRS